MTSLLDALSPDIPALQRAVQGAALAATVGFDWPDREGVLAKIDEERQELQEALEQSAPEAVFHELGDLLLSITNLARVLGMDPEEALRAANKRFEARFRYMEAMAPGDLGGLSLDELEALWVQAKRTLHPPEAP